MGSAKAKCVILKPDLVTACLVTGPCMALAVPPAPKQGPSGDPRGTTQIAGVGCEADTPSLPRVNGGAQSVRLRLPTSEMGMITPTT